LPIRDRRYVEDLSTEELEELLLTRRRDEHLARARRLATRGRLDKAVIVANADQADPALQSRPESLADTDDWGSVQIAEPHPRANGHRGGTRSWRDRILLVIESAALIGLIAVIFSLVISVRNLNREWKGERALLASPEPTATALIRASILPGGHQPPTESGGEAQPLGSVASLALPTPGPRAPTRLVIPSISVDVTVVEGDDWEQLKKGGGHHIGSANPGERGNVVISGHNDIYGEVFRYLEKVKTGDEVIVYASEQAYRYIVRAPPRIVEPDDVSVMYPTSKATVTLLTCHPYMVDTRRLVVIGELER
jgi:sortase A